MKTAKEKIKEFLKFRDSTLLKFYDKSFLYDNWEDDINQLSNMICIEIWRKLFKFSIYIIYNRTNDFKSFFDSDIDPYCICQELKQPNLKALQCKTCNFGKHKGICIIDSSLYSIFYSQFGKIINLIGTELVHKIKEIEYRNLQSTVNFVNEIKNHNLFKKNK